MDLRGMAHPVDRSGNLRPYEDRGRPWLQPNTAQHVRQRTYTSLDAVMSDAVLCEHAYRRRQQPDTRPPPPDPHSVTDSLTFPIICRLILAKERVVIYCTTREASATIKEFLCADPSSKPLLPR
jgi:hypothetical protein